MDLPLAYAHLGVIGSGGWGTALAVLANRAGTRTTLFTRNDYVLQSILENRMNAAYLPEVFLDPSIEVSKDMAKLSECDAVLVVVPAQSLRAVMIVVSDLVSTNTPVIIATKGIERGSLLLMGEVVQSILPQNPQAILTGPNFAQEAALGKPTASVLATHHEEIAHSLSYLLNSKFFRVYQHDDPIGAQIGGALKNVLAIACGIADGMELGENARAALITRGIAEMGRIAKAKGGNKETLLGLAGVGDITLTCTSARSRNYAFGLAVGKGHATPTKQTSASGKMVLQEGVATAESAFYLAQKLGVATPVIEAVYAVLHDNKSPEKAIEYLLDRPVLGE